MTAFFGERFRTDVNSYTSAEELAAVDVTGLMDGTRAIVDSVGIYQWYSQATLGEIRANGVGFWNLVTDAYLMLNDANEIDLSQLSQNFIKNPQFTIWDHEPVNFPGGNVIDTTHTQFLTLEQICDGWHILKSYPGTFGDVIDNITQQTFELGQTEVPGNPIYYLQYNCTHNVNQLEFEKAICQEFIPVTFLANEKVIFSIAMKADRRRTISISVTQNFGSGGGASPPAGSIIVPSFDITTEWETYTFEVDIPSIAGKTLGSNLPNESFLLFLINLPLNTTCQVNMCNVLVKSGANSNSVNFPTQTREQQKSLLEEKFQIATATKSILDLPSYKTSRVSQGWLQLKKNTTIGRPASGATFASLAYLNLFATLYNQYANTQCPVSGGRSGDAIADWNSGKTLTLPAAQNNFMGVAGDNDTYANGQTGGSATVSILSDNIGPHTHPFDGIIAALGSPNNGYDPQTTPVIGDMAGNTWVAGTTDNSRDEINNLLGTELNEGGSTPLNILNPYIMFQVYIHI